jgi:hypothetical protein
MYVVDPNSRTANKLKRRHAEERERRRALSKPFQFEGNAKHLILQFTATVKKLNEESFQFEGPGVAQELYHKVGANSRGPQKIGNGAAPSSRNSSQSDEVDPADAHLSIKWQK